MKRLLVLALLVGGCTASAPGASVDAGAQDSGSGDAGQTDSGARDAGPLDAGQADAGTDAGDSDAGPVDAGPLTLTIFPRVGSAADSTVAPRGPGLILMGGGSDVDDAFIWMHDALAGDGGSAGDVVILRATGSNGYDAYVFGLASFNSVQTLLLPPPSTGADLQAAADIVSRAEAVFLAGGNQADYVAWKGTPLADAIQAVYARGGVVGGTSAGLASLGDFVFDAIAAGSGNVTTADVLADPYDPAISFTSDFLTFPALTGVITDTHFVTRDRFGRLAGFMARQLADGTASEVVGVGVDEATALVVDRDGLGTLLMQSPGGSAYVLRGGPAQQCAPGLPLEFPGVQVMRLDAVGEVWDFARGCGTGVAFTVDVSGGAAQPYSVDPYSAPGAQGSCP